MSDDRDALNVIVFTFLTPILFTAVEGHRLETAKEAALQYSMAGAFNRLFKECFNR